MEDETKPKNETWRNKARPAIYAMAGFYLVYMAYSMFRNISASKGSEQMLMIVFTILFSIIGLAMIILGLKAGYQSRAHEEKD